jgi:hypothetical protein
MSISSKMGKLAGKVVTGSKAAPKATKRKLTALKNELAEGYRSASDTNIADD